MMTSQNSNSSDSPPFIKVNAVESAFTFGFMGLVGNNSSQMADCRMYSDDASATMETFSSSGTDDRCFGQFAFKSGAWALDGSFVFSSMDSDGFTCRESGATPPAIGYYIGYLAVRGSNWEVVQKLTPSSTGTQAIVNSGGFTPSGAIFTYAGSGAGERAALMHGWASNDGGAKPFPEGAAYLSDDHAVTTSDAKRVTDLTRAFASSLVTVSSVRNDADLHSWDSSGLTLDWQTATDANLEYHAIMFGGAGTPFEGGTGVDEGMIAFV